MQFSKFQRLTCYLFHQNLFVAENLPNHTRQTLGNELVLFADTNTAVNTCLLGTLCWVIPRPKNKLIKLMTQSTRKHRNPISSNFCAPGYEVVTLCDAVH